MKPDNYRCDSTNVEYLVHCQDAQKHNILEEQVKISEESYTHYVRQKKPLPLQLHFNADGHNINYLKVCIMKRNFKDAKHKTDLQFIINFESNKFWFNKDISFLSRYDTFR